LPRQIILPLGGMILPLGGVTPPPPILASSWVYQHYWSGLSPLRRSVVLEQIDLSLLKQYEDLESDGSSEMHHSLSKDIVLWSLIVLFQVVAAHWNISSYPMIGIGKKKKTTMADHCTNLQIDTINIKRIEGIVAQSVPKEYGPSLGS